MMARGCNTYILLKGGDNSCYATRLTHLTFRWWKEHHMKEDPFYILLGDLIKYIGTHEIKDDILFKISSLVFYIK